MGRKSFMKAEEYDPLVLPVPHLSYRSLLICMVADTCTWPHLRIPVYARTALRERHWTRRKDLHVLVLAECLTGITV